MRKKLFTSHQNGSFNKDLDQKRNLEYYLNRTKDFKSSFKPFEVVDLGGKFVIDESQSCEVGYKARAGEFLLQNVKESGFKEIVYVQPRQGFAGISLAYLCKKYDLDLTLVMPSSKKVSDHQLLCIELGAKPLFIRVAAMPNANRMAKLYAEETGAYFVPLGLYHEDVIACGVKEVYDFFKDLEKPKEMWSAISTGVLSRTLQIALPETDFYAVGVARNIQHGELGRAKFLSYHKPFSAKSDLVPIEFDSEDRYDSKAFHYFVEESSDGSWFFNVAGNAPKPTIDHNSIDSYRDWGDYRDFKFYNI